MSLFLIPLFALLNRARGTRLFNLTTSTVVGRLAATFGMAALAGISLSADPYVAALAFAWSWAALMLWCTPGWDAYWSAAIGNDLAHSRLWGAGMMALRQTLAAPWLAGIAYLTHHTPVSILGTPLIGLIYYAAGYAYPKNPIALAEYLTGACLGTLLMLTVN